MSALSNSTCPVCRTAEVVCGKWTLLLIRDLADGSSRFCELERSLEGISPRTLSLRLRALEEEGIVERHTYPEVPPRVEYALTDKGRGAGAADRRHAQLRHPLAAGGETPSPPPPSRSNVQIRRVCKAPCRRRSAAGRAEAWAVRDFLLNEALKRLATEAATRFSSLVAERRPDPLRRRRRERRRLGLLQLRAADRRASSSERAEELRSLPSFGPGPRGRGRGRRRRRLPGGARRGRPRRPGRAGRTDADRLHSPRSGRGRTGFALDRARLDERPLDARRRSARRRRRRRPDRPDRRPADVDRRGCSCRTACGSSAPTRSTRRSTRCAARAWAAPPGSRSSSPSPSSTPTKAPRRPSTSCAS